MIAAAVSDPDKPTSTVVPSTGTSLPITISCNGCRRVDVPGPGPYADHGCFKLMAQNVKKDSAAARRAKAGAKIVVRERSKPALSPTPVLSSSVASTV